MTRGRIELLPLALYPAARRPSWRGREVCAEGMEVEVPNISEGAGGGKKGTVCV